MLVLLRTSQVTLEEIDTILSLLRGVDAEVYASIYPYENPVSSVLNSEQRVLTPHSGLEAIASSVRLRSKLPDSLSILLVTRTPLVRVAQLYCSEKFSACVIACPPSGECSLPGLHRITRIIDMISR